MVFVQHITEQVNHGRLAQGDDDEVVQPRAKYNPVFTGIMGLTLKKTQTPDRSFGLLDVDKVTLVQASDNKLAEEIIAEIKNSGGYNLGQAAFNYFFTAGKFPVMWRGKSGKNTTYICFGNAVYQTKEDGRCFLCLYYDSLGNLQAGYRLLDMGCSGNYFFATISGH